MHLLALVLEWLQTYYDILQTAIVKVEEQLTSAGAAAVAAGAEGQEWVEDSGLYEFEKMFANYSEVSTLITSRLLYWVRSVCATNSKCLVEVLKPDIPGCAQVGKMWNKAHDSIARYKRTLTIIFHLDSFHRQGKLDSFLEVFNTVMPLWMEKLVDLRSEPGKMAGLQDQLRLIFSTQNKKHEQGLRIFNFIWKKFRSKNSDEQQLGLFWLQDLTRLNIPIPYLPHMFDDALKEFGHKGFSKMPTLQSVSSSFDLGLEREDTRKESVTSGSETEAHLVSQSSMEQMDTQVIVTLKSSLTRYILMLDIWLSQLTQLPKESIPTLELSVFQNNLIMMLQKVWGSSHDHKESTSVCYLCRGVAVWFDLVTKLLKEYAKLVHREGSAGEEFEELSSPYHRISTRSDRLRQLVSTPRSAGSDSSEASSALLGAGRRQSVEWLDEVGASPPREKEGKKFGIQGGIQALHGGAAAAYQNEPEHPKHHKRKIAQVQSHSQFRVVSDAKLGVVSFSDGHPGREVTPSTYIIFQLCSLKLQKVSLQSDTLLKIASCLMSLVRDWRALDMCEDQDTVSEDVTQLFGILWKSLDTSSSNTVRACVELLLECAKYLADAKPLKKSLPTKGAALFQKLSDSEEESEEEENRECEIEEQLLWDVIHTGLTSTLWSNRFKAAEMFTMIVQFMRRPGSSDTDVLSVHSKVQGTIAHGFCLLVQLLVDKNSNVCSRAKYLISTIKESSLEAMKFYLKNFFYEYPTYRIEILSTLSLLDSSLPELKFLSVDILTNLLRIATSLHESPVSKPGGNGELERLEVSLQLDPKKKASDVSVYPGDHTPRVSATTIISIGEDPIKQKITERILSLLLRHIANPRVDITESMKKGQGQKSKKGSTIKGRRSTPSSSEEHLLRMIRVTIFQDFQSHPQDLRKSSVFEIFLNHMFSVLDHNIEFGQTKGMLPFVLRLLCFSAAPSLLDYTQFKAEEKKHLQRDPRLLHFPPNVCTYSLSSLPPRLQAPWLRIFFVILYKYIHDYSEVDPGHHYQGWEVLTLTQWCLQITLNTMESEGHECSFLSNSPKKKGVLQRQLTIDPSILESLTGDIPTVNIAKGSPSASPYVARAKSQEMLSEDKEQVKAKSSTRTAESAGNDKVKAEPVSVPGICIACDQPTNEYSEEVIAVAVVALGTCCHRLPHTVSGYLVSRIIPAVARVVVPGSFCWQATRNTAEPPPGSAMAVAKHIMGSVLTQFGDRRLFLFLFGTDYGKKSHTVFTALAHGLMGIEGEAPIEGGDGEIEGELSETTIIKFFLQDAIASIKDLHPHSIVNLALYIDTLDQIQEGASASVQLTKELLLWDSFFKKLKSNLDVLRNKKAMHAFLRVLIKLFRNSLEYPTPPTLGNYHTHTVQSLSQSLFYIIEFALYNVYIPVGGLVELGSVWYRLFQQHSHREAEKLMKLYVSELRKVLKARGSSGSSEQYPRMDNALGLIQVLLLEESGYLGYIDGLTTKKCFAPDLKVNCETHSLPVITALQWDFCDVLSYISSIDTTSAQFVPQLKLSLAQLVALRAQHGRSPPTDKLKRLISEGDPRSLLPPPTTFRSTVVHMLQPRWQDYVRAIRVLSWLLLGAMSHNYIDAIAADMKMAGSVNTGGPCHLLESLNQKLDKMTKGVLDLVCGVLQQIAVSNDGNSGYLYLAFLFASTWTVYMELYTKESTALIVEFWQKLTGRLAYLMEGDNLSEIYRGEVIETLNKYVVVRIKAINLSCYSLLVPIWREVTRCMANTKIVFPDIEEAQNTPVDRWLKETINELVILEQEWQTDT